jgi:hypothetical protein
MQYFVHRPSPFISNHLDSLLPEWSRPVASVLIVLQPCNCDLLERTDKTEEQKQLLRRQFLQFGRRVARKLQHLGHLADLFDPRTGLPLFSQPGQLWLDDVAVVRACLGYQSVSHCGCSVLIHPVWGNAVYPSTLVSSAAPDLVELVARSECHQSRRDCGSLTE